MRVSVFLGSSWDCNAWELESRCERTVQEGNVVCHAQLVQGCTALWTVSRITGIRKESRKPCEVYENSEAQQILANTNFVVPMTHISRLQGTDSCMNPKRILSFTRGTIFFQVRSILEQNYWLWVSTKLVRKEPLKFISEWCPCYCSSCMSAQLNSVNCCHNVRKVVVPILVSESHPI